LFVAETGGIEPSMHPWQDLKLQAQPGKIQLQRFAQGLSEGPWKILRSKYIINIH
jgi:hypothetical protein